MVCNYCGVNDGTTDVNCQKCSRRYCQKCKKDVFPFGIETIEKVEVSENVFEEKRTPNHCFKCSPKRLYGKCNKCNKLCKIVDIVEKCYICNRKYCNKCKNTENHGLGVCVIIEEEQQ